MLDEELTGEESDRLRKGVNRIELPERLEERVIGALERDGLIESRHAVLSSWSSSLRFASAAALGLVAFFAGYLLASRDATSTGTPGDAYMFLLREGPESNPQSPAEIERIVGEYRAWARDIAGKGLLLGAEKLEVRGVVVMPDTRIEDWSESSGFIGGYFIVRADSYEEATSIARGCPHLRYGGTIEVRRVDPT